MSKFRKKPVEIEAMRFTGRRGRDLATILAFCPIAQPIKEAHGSTLAFLVIPTLEGQMQANPGDWVIRGVKGEFYPCKPDIFDATYEPVKESA